MAGRQFQRQPALFSPANPAADARSRIEALFGSPQTINPASSGTNDLDQWRHRRLEPDYALVFFDSLVVRVREQGLLCAKRIHLALGILEDGTKDVIGFWMCHPTSVHSWTSAMTEFRARGVVELRIVVAEENATLVAAGESFPAVRIFRSIKHLTQDSVGSLPSPEREKVAAHLLGFFGNATPNSTLDDLADLISVRINPGVAAFWRRHWDAAAPILELSPALRDVLCTTSAVESVVEKLRRRGLARRSSFASPEAAIRDLLLVLRDAKASWKVSPQKWAAVRRDLMKPEREMNPYLA